MTKEEILESIEGHSVMADINIYDGALDSIYTAMDQYAFFNAIAFAKWVAENCWYRETDKVYTFKKSPIIKTISELYKIFLESKQS